MRRFVAALALLLPLPAAAADTCTLRGLAGSAGIHVGAGFVEGSQRPEFREILAREYATALDDALGADLARADHTR